MKLLHLLNITACLLSALIASVAYAHDGHGEHGGALAAVLHWFTQWDHLVVIGLVVVGIVFAIRYGRYARKRETL